MVLMMRDKPVRWSEVVALDVGPGGLRSERGGNDASRRWKTAMCLRGARLDRRPSWGAVARLHERTRDPDEA